jgi:hypothetical protein
VLWKHIGTARLLVKTQHEATLIPAAAIGRSERSETVITNQHKEGSVSYLNVITAQTTALKNETIAVKIPGPANELYFV